MNLAGRIDEYIFRTISGVAQEENLPAYVIGGYVRDLILGRPSVDVDIMTVGSGIDLARKVASKIDKRIPVHYFKNFGTAMFRYDDGKQNWIIEFVGARRESYSRDSRKPVVENGTLEDDQNRRDFTINAMALDLAPDHYGELIDPFNGLADIEKKIIRTPRDPGITYSDDPLRMLRAIRFATQLNFTVDPTSFDAIIRNKERIRIISRERINDELQKIIASDKPGRGFVLLDKSGLLAYIFPQLQDLKGAEFVDGKGHKDNFLHTLEVLDNVAEKSNNIWLRWAALLHDIAKPATKKYDPETGWTFHSHEYVGYKMIPVIFRKMKLPMNEKMRYVQKLVLLHLRPIVLSEESVSDSAIRRLLYEAGEDIDDLMLLSEADITSKNPRKVLRYLKNFTLVRKKMKEIEEKDRIRNWQPPISGETIMKVFNIPSGKVVGIIKNSIREAILDGEINNEYDEAYRFMIEKGKQLGLNPTENHPSNEC
ncbi:MAG: HD domain-containing protein [Bacteroidales bacterium]